MKQDERHSTNHDSNAKENELLTRGSECGCRVNWHEAGSRIQLKLTFDGNAWVVLAFESRCRWLEGDAACWVRSFYSQHSRLRLRSWFIWCIYAAYNLNIWVVGRTRVLNPRVRTFGVVCQWIAGLCSWHETILDIWTMAIATEEVVGSVPRMLSFELGRSYLHL